MLMAGKYGARKLWNLKNEIAALRHFEIYKNLNNFRNVCPIFTKFGTELHFETAQTLEGSNVAFFTIQDGHRTESKIYQKWNYLRFAPNLVSTAHSEHAYGPIIVKFVIKDGRRWPFCNLQ